MGKAQLKQLLRERLQKSEEAASQQAKKIADEKKRAAKKNKKAPPKSPKAAPITAKADAKPDKAKNAAAKPKQAAEPEGGAAAAPSKGKGKAVKSAPKTAQEAKPSHKAKEADNANLRKVKKGQPVGKHAMKENGAAKKEKKAKKAKAAAPAPAASADIAKSGKPKAAPASDAALTELQQAMAKKLEGAQFRWLNEQLYTVDGKQALNLMKQQPHLFDMYHTGFRAQAAGWPENPVERILGEIRAHQPAPAVVADLGCGDALLAQKLAPEGYTVHSFDLVAKPPLVVAADMASVPLKPATCDVVVFSLSLMNTNWGAGAAEGARILKKGGVMKIAEVVSRIENVDKFIEHLQELGLHVMNKDQSNPMFIMLNLRKKGNATCTKSAAAAFPPLKPCVYKKRS